jgi:hypothetical protein
MRIEFTCEVNKPSGSNQGRPTSEKTKIAANVGALILPCLAYLIYGVRIADKDE